MTHIRNEIPYEVCGNSLSGTAVVHHSFSFFRKKLPRLA